MAGRGSVVSDARVIEAAQAFTPAADEVWRLQRGDDADCQFFQRAINKGELITDRGSRQGFWVFAPSGKLLAKVNSNRADTVLAMMARGLEAFEALPAEERRLADDAELDAAFRWEDNHPKEGLSLERYGRDLVGGLDPAGSGGRFNVDAVWFSAAEARSWLPDDPRVGATQLVPDELSRRLARFVLVDNVRGQTLPYAAAEVREARLDVEVVAREGALVEVSLTGSTRMVADGPWLLGEGMWKPKREHPRGIQTALVGRATFDLEAGAFTEFEAVALGERWGRSTMNGRQKQTEPSAVGFHLTLSDPTRVIAPTFLALYEADWVQRPEGWADHPENRP